MRGKRRKKFSGKKWRNNAKNDRVLRKVAEKNEQFILENMNLIYYFRNRFRNMGISIPSEDMDQIGYIAMLKAIRDFDSNFSKKAFSVYFRYKFQGDLMREYKTNYYSEACRPPINYWDGISKVIRYIKIQREKHNHKPDIAEIARAIKIRKSRVEFCLKTLGQKEKISLSERISEDGEETQIDFLPDKTPYNQEDLTFLHHWAEKFILHLKKNLSDERRRPVIANRIGLVQQDLYCKKKIALKNVGEMFGISKERVRQIEKKFTHKTHDQMDLENQYGVKKENVSQWIRDVISLIRELDAKYDWQIDFESQI